MCVPIKFWGHLVIIKVLNRLQKSTMASKNQYGMFADASGKAAGMTEDKFALYESSRTDSGFISGEISEEQSQLLTESEVIEESVNKKDMQLHLDSGVVLSLSDNFSSLSLDPDLNNLNPPITTKPEKQKVPWELYYEQDEDGDTLLHSAIVQGFLEVVLAIIRAAPRPHLLDTPNDDAQSPLHYAVATKQWKIVRWLIVAGAKPSPRNRQGDSPLHICARTGDVQSCKAITDPVTQTERDALALTYPPQPYQPCQLDQWNYDGQTCVHVAAMYGHIDVLRHLIWNGADINAREGTKGYTALHYALERVDEQMAHFLLYECKKLNPNVLTYGQRSVLQLGFSVPSGLAEALRSRGVESPFTSDSEYEEDSEDELPYDNMSIYKSSIIQANA